MSLEKLQQEIQNKLNKLKLEEVSLFCVQNNISL